MGYRPPPLSGRVPCPWACCFLMPTATAGCSCLWREYAADAVECVLVSKVDKLKMPRRCQPVNHAVPNVSCSSPPFMPCDRCCHEFLITATALLSLVCHFTAVHKQPVSVSFDTPRITFQRCDVSVGR